MLAADSVSMERCEGNVVGYDNAPSLMLATPGCCACDEMGALLAGVFCGVLEGWSVIERTEKGRKATDGAVCKSSFLFLMGSAMLTEWTASELLCAVERGREGKVEGEVAATEDDVEKWNFRLENWVGLLPLRQKAYSVF